MTVEIFETSVIKAGVNPSPPRPISSRGGGSHPNIALRGLYSMKLTNNTKQLIYFHQNYIDDVIILLTSALFVSYISKL